MRDIDLLHYASFFQDLHVVVEAAIGHAQAVGDLLDGPGGGELEHHFEAGGVQERFFAGRGEFVRHSCKWDRCHDCGKTPTARQDQVGSAEAVLLTLDTKPDILHSPHRTGLRTSVWQRPALGECG